MAFVVVCGGCWWSCSSPVRARRSDAFRIKLRHVRRDADAICEAKLAVCSFVNNSSPFGRCAGSTALFHTEHFVSSTLRTRVRRGLRSAKDEMRCSLELNENETATEKSHEPDEHAPSTTREVALLYACPNCGIPMNSVTSAPQIASSKSSASCSNCGVRFGRVRGLNGVPDLTYAASRTRDVIPLLRARSPARQELFRSPIVSWLYERGWRDQFASSGFPGIEEEFELMLEWFRKKQALAAACDENADAKLHGVALDLSCGSGLMVRRMLRSGVFVDRLVALDYSESMVRETVLRFDQPSEIRGSSSAFIRSERTNTCVDVIRGDASRLPFAECSVSWIHSGAAMHCWPVVQDALAECHRVLQPGGAMFATTFLWPVRALRRGAPRDIRFFGQEELHLLFRAAGFREVSVERRRNCAIIRAAKT